MHAEVNITPRAFLPCTPDADSTINGIDIDLDDFGYSKDHDEARTDNDDYCCVYRKFHAYRDPSHTNYDDETVLDKYGIDEDDYYEICDMLENIFEVGYCALCS